MSFGFFFGDPFVLVLHNTTYSIDEPLHHLEHLIRDSYRQHLLTQASLRRQDCRGKTGHVDVRLTRSFYLSQHDPVNKFTLRFILTSSVDHVVVYFGPIWFLVHYASLFPI